jgi:hypothetical protein
MAFEEVDQPRAVGLGSQHGLEDAVDLGIKGMTQGGERLARIGGADTPSRLSRPTKNAPGFPRAF